MTLAIRPGDVTVRDAVLALLGEFGIDTIFGNPGSTELPLFRDFPDHVRYVLGLQESVVMGMADGYAQATDNAAFVNLHSAAGVGHSLGNLFTACKNKTPLIVTAGQQARSIMPYEPYLFAERATEFPQPYVKWAIEPARAQDVPHALARAYYTAMQPPRGPVFLSIPVDDWDQPCMPVAARRVSRRVRGDAALLREVGEALADAARPAFVVGAGVAHDRAWSHVVALAELHEAAVWVAPVTARCGFPEDHRLFAGFLPASREGIVERLAGADVVLVLGGAVSTYHIEGFGPHMPVGAQVFHLVDDPAVAAWSPAGTAIVTDLASATATLLDHRPPRQRMPPATRPRTPAPSATGLTDAYVFNRIAALRPHRSIIVEEAPSSRNAMHEHLPIVAEDGFFAGASGGLGHGMPAAIGIALGRRDEKVIAILGDGSSMYAIQALWTVAQLGLPVSFIILNNARYEALIGFGRHFGLEETIGTKLPGLDFPALAAGQGVTATRVEAPAALDAALEASFAADRPTLVDIAIR